MSGLVIDLAAARRVLRELTPRSIALIGSIPDLNVPMPGSEWTLGEAAAHVVFGAELYAEYGRGAEWPAPIDRADLAESHRRRVAELMPQGAGQLGADLRLGIDAFLTTTESRAAEDLLPWHQGPLPCATMTGLLIGEQLLHGYDIAQTLGAEWHIGDEPARLTVQAVLPILPALVDGEAAKSVDTTYELAVDGGPRVLARFRDGAVIISPVIIGAPEDADIDCRLSGDPVAWLLALYGRADWEQLLCTGRVKVTIGDAVLGDAFKQLLHNP